MTAAQQRMLAALKGLSVGEAYGQQLWQQVQTGLAVAEQPSLLPAPWLWTDATLMACSLVDHLWHYGTVHSAALAADFALRYTPIRDYGTAMHTLLAKPRDGAAVMSDAQNLFDGQGSFGVGAAMRAAPLGLFFAEAPLSQVAQQAQLSALTTHTNPEAVAGAVAVAVAGAILWRERDQPLRQPSAILNEIGQYLPSSSLEHRLALAAAMNDRQMWHHIALRLSNGYQHSAQAIVPWCLWCAVHYRADYAAAIEQVCAAGGNVTSMAAIVGGLLAGTLGRDCIPPPWLRAREPLPHWFLASLGIETD